MSDPSQSTRELDRLGYSSAEICRMKGWTVGDRLMGDDASGGTVIRLTAIGEDVVLARQESNRNDRECPWGFSWREWRKL